ncbi:MAG TPA: SIS domain-containing protein [Mesorhizobium sp.]|jgi:glucosamine--fructose-6-phosphate aminotransferase (isomerizing)|nr:SIS domain-containing protein [Mesorhizobium sp.]
MRREVEEAPDAVRRLLDRSGESLASAGRALAELDPVLIATVARGSSDHAATLLKYAVEIAAGVPVASVGPSVASIYGVTPKLGQAAAIAISQSGKSPDIVSMAEAAARGGALTLALVNDPSSPLAKAVRHSIDICAGPERSVAATKSFVGSAAAGLALLAHWRGDCDLLAALETLPDALERALGCDWSGLAQTLEAAGSVFVLGRGPAFAIAGEAALKLKETCGLHAEPFSAAEVMHGPLAILREGFPVLAFAAEDQAEAGVAEAADALAEKGAAVWATTNQVKAARALPVARAGHPLLDPLPLAVSFYLMAEGLARRRGLDPDSPPHLKKVTETR